MKTNSKGGNPGPAQPFGTRTGLASPRPSWAADWGRNLCMPSERP